MAATKYTFSVSVDFPNHKVDSDRLTLEIRASTIVIALDYIETDGDECDIWFKDELSAADVSVLDAVVAAHSGEPMPQPAYEADGTPIFTLKTRQGDDVPEVAIAPNDGSEWVIGTHNFCDPCTWFGDSVRSVDEVLTDSGDGLTFESTHDHWIDMVSGRMHNDDIWVQIQQILNPSDPHGYQVAVTVDDVPAVMREPFEDEGGDYTVNWHDGKITFFGSRAGSVVKASYSYATTSTFYVRPFPGKWLVIVDAECDTSTDIVMTDSLVYSSWELDGSEYVKNMEAMFKRAGQIMVEARGCFPEYMAKGATPEELALPTMEEFRLASRGMKYNRQAAPFVYKTAKNLRSQYGQEVRVQSKHHRQIIGEHVTMTFYCLEKDDG